MTKPYYCSFHKKFTKFNAGKSSVTTLLTFTWPNPKRREKYAIKQHRTTIVKPNPITFLQPCIGGKTLYNVQLCAPQKNGSRCIGEVASSFCFREPRAPQFCLVFCLFWGKVHLVAKSSDGFGLATNKKWRSYVSSAIFLVVFLGKRAPVVLVSTWFEGGLTFVVRWKGRRL